jgi:hypothetical protein
VIISLKLRVWSTNKIDAIKLIRPALNVGLVESKRLVEAAQLDYTQVFLNADQFARLYSLVYADGDFSISDYKLIGSVEVQFNFSGAEVTPSAPAIRPVRELRCDDPNCNICEYGTAADDYYPTQEAD